ncbi:MAG: 4-hydroxy-3-methylbut-2-enyl diphosphate reductase [Bacteroidetes bacterium]|nr:MAG: 4-hydroxy-3-methylbut-2-enyl diphosphate reductase [Bacteroidota bacterium]
MARSFDLPSFYHSTLVSRIKEIRSLSDPMKRDLSPSLLDFGPVKFHLARHFGFCYGVENAIDIAYRALDEHPGDRIYLLSEIIHNERVNQDLRERGIRFLRTTSGKQLIPFSELRQKDIVIIPAFGTTIEIENELTQKGIDIRTYDTTCPFVEKVWRRSSQIGENEFTVIIHGKRQHEETQATFSHAQKTAPVIVVRDLEEAQILSRLISGDGFTAQFYDSFEDRCSKGFDPNKDLVRVGVVNQTTMLATETAAIAELLKSAMAERYGAEQVDDHFADTSDTLCYATNENQDATRALLDQAADTAVIVGGINSSNTSHLVEICKEQLPTYFISSADQISGLSRIEHFDLRTKKMTQTDNWLNYRPPVRVLLGAGASCPDIILEEVVAEITSSFEGIRTNEDVISDFSESIT